MVEAIWDSITENGDTLELSDDTKQILDERLESHAKNPEEGHRWPDVKARIKGQF